MNPLFAAAVRVQEFCNSHNWETCFIGGLTVQRWGEQRQTKDGDLTLLTRFQNEEHYVDTLLTAFHPRREDAREFALRHRVLLIEDSSGIPFDIALAGLPFEERTIERATQWKLESGDSIVTCSAEDLIIHKAFAGRARDWADIERVVQRHGDALNFQLIFEELRPLLALKEEPQNEERLRQLMEREGL